VKITSVFSRDENINILLVPRAYIKLEETNWRRSYTDGKFCYLSKVLELKIVIRDVLPNVAWLNGKIRERLKTPSCRDTLHSLNCIKKKLEPSWKIKHFLGDTGRDLRQKFGVSIHRNRNITIYIGQLPTWTLYRN